MRRLSALLIGLITFAPASAAFANEPPNGLDLVVYAEEQHGLQYQFGYGGEVVCQLANIPESPRSRCLRQGDPFWGYWKGDGDGGWNWSGEGANKSEVRDGDVEGWAWGEGFDGRTHQSPGEDGERITFESICRGSVPPAVERAALVVDLGDEAPEGDDGVYKLCIRLPESDTDGSGGSPGPGDPGSDDPAGDPDVPGAGGGGDDGSTPDTSGSDPGPRPNKPPGLPGGFPSAEPEPDERLIDSAPDMSELTDAPTPEAVATELPPSATTAGSETQEFPLAGALALVVTFVMAGIAVLLVRKRTPIQPKE